MELRSSESSGRRPLLKRRPLGDVTNLAAPSSSVDASSGKLSSRPGARAKPIVRAVPGEISTRFEANSIGPCVSGDADGPEGVPSTSDARAGETSASSVDICRGNIEPSKGVILPSTKKRKNEWKEGADVLQSSFPPVERIRSTGNYLKIQHEDVDCRGACSVPYPKRKKKWRYTMSEVVKKRQVGFPRDFIEQQRAYFAEIDAFELPEEEVASESELE